MAIHAHDDSDRDYGPLTLSIGANETMHFNSHDLEQGNPEKRLSGSAGTGEGDWRLELSSDLDIEVLSYIRTEDGFLTAMHDVVPAVGGQYRVATFNPASNTDQQSLLRLTNRGDEDASLTVTGIDDSGESPGGAVTVTITAGRSMTLNAAQLESGAEGFEGALGNGAGKWRLAVDTDQPITVMSLLLSPTGHLTNLSTAPGRTPRPESPQAVEDEFRMRISPIVQSKCINCHVEGGASGDTRLVFVRDTEADHEATNLRVFQNFLATVENGASRILNKIQGVDHGGGIQVAAGSAEFGSMRTFLELLGGSGDQNVHTVTAGDLFDTVRMESPRRTLYRAAMIFAGRVPTAGELAPFPGGTMKQLRDTVRRMMTGPEFHEFVIRGANDRLLTDSLGLEDILANGHKGVISNNEYSQFSGYEAERERLQAGGPSSGGRYSDEYYRWFNEVRFGARQAPLELIAHIAENDLPYTEILAADYIMANPAAAGAYSAPVAFDDPGDPFEFQPTRIRGYRHGGIALDNYPHAGILNTTSFLRRYPTTPTNRNRARARWTYQHFLGVDIQNSAPTVTDADALLDTRNPTMHNPACTICHITLDPAAGAYQNYADTGFYRPTTRGEDALPGVYVSPQSAAREHPVNPSGSAESTTIVEKAVPLVVGSRLFLSLRYDYQNIDAFPVVRIDSVVLRDYDTAAEYPVDPQTVRGGSTGANADWAVERSNDASGPVLRLQGRVTVEVDPEIPSDARYDVEIQARSDDTGVPGTLSVSATEYRRGDTWFRDMREPGFEGKVAPDADTSLRWLGERMAADPRFAEGAVKFWWPAIMGSSIALPPASGDPEFEARLLTATAQAAEVERLARQFRYGFHAGDRPYNLKDLLAAMVLSPWFRAERNQGDDPLRAAALRTAGAKRLLTPEELDRKTGSLTGYKWRRWIDKEGPSLDRRIRTAFTDDYELLYGGIDSQTNLIRSRDVTAIIAAVAKAHAIRSSCLIALREFYLLPQQGRYLFDGIDIDTAPETTDGERTIRNKLSELHFKFFGIEVGPDSEDVDTAFALFVETLARKQGDKLAGTAFRDGNRCDTSSDMLLLEGVVDPPIVIEGEGYFEERYVQNDPDGILNKTYEDPDHLARTWVVVLAYMMMDYRYLYL